MSYPMDLDEYSDEGLAAEVQRRARCRAKGQCSYCGRPVLDRPCRFPERHTTQLGREP